MDLSEINMLANSPTLTASQHLRNVIERSSTCKYLTPQCLPREITFLQVHNLQLPEISVIFSSCHHLTRLVFTEYVSENTINEILSLPTIKYLGLMLDSQTIDYLEDKEYTNIKSLTVYSLEDCYDEDQKFEYAEFIKKIVKLKPCLEKFIIVDQSHVGQECFRALSKLKYLRSVALDSVELNDDTIRYLFQNLPDIEELRIEDLILEEQEVIQQIRSLTKLKTLALRGSKLSEEGLRLLISNLPLSITSFDYSLSGILTVDLIKMILAKLPNLKGLKLESAQLNDKLVEAISLSGVQLRELSVAVNKLTMLGIVHIANYLPNLISLNLNRCIITQIMLQIVCKDLKHLEELNIKSLASLTHKGLIYLKKLKNLKVLSVGAEIMSYKLIYRVLQNWKWLEKLFVNRNLIDSRQTRMVENVRQVRRGLVLK